MKTSPILLALGLMLWGFASTYPVIGGVLAIAWLVAARSHAHLTLAEPDLMRVVDLTAVAAILTTGGLLAAQGLPNGLLLATGWLPLALFPLMVVSRLSSTPVTLRHLAYSLRRSHHPEAQRPVDLLPPYLAVTLLAAGTIAKPSPWFYWVLALLIGGWLFAARPKPHSARLAAFIAASLLAISGGFALGFGLERTQLALQQWISDVLSNADADPFRSQTRIGDLGQLKLTEGIVWRVEKVGSRRSPLLLRTGVFSYYSRGIWGAHRNAFEPMPPVRGAAQVLLHLQGETRKGMALIPMPLEGGRPEGHAGGRVDRGSYGVIRISDASTELDLTILSQAHTPPPPPETADLSVPQDFQKLFNQLPALHGLRERQPSARLVGLESWFREHFRYTLFLGDQSTGARDLARFLLKDHAGHCEYFATSTVLILRSLGIPARYVTGYSVQEYSRLERAYLLRNRHAHAWVDAWIDGRWVEVDTTPSTWLEAEEDAAPFWLPAYDLLSYLGRRLGEWRRDLMSLEPSSWLVAFAGSTVLVLAALLLRRVRRQQQKRIKPTRQQRYQAPPSSESAAFLKLERELAALGLARHASEPPRSWLQRLRQDGQSILTTSQLEQAHATVEALYRQRYSTKPC